MLISTGTKCVKTRVVQRKQCKTLPVGVFLEVFASDKSAAQLFSDSRLSHSDACYSGRFHLSHVGLMTMEKPESGLWKRKSLHSCSVSKDFLDVYEIVCAASQLTPLCDRMLGACMTFFVSYAVGKHNWLLSKFDWRYCSDALLCLTASHGATRMTSLQKQTGWSQTSVMTWAMISASQACDSDRNGLVDVIVMQPKLCSISMAFHGVSCRYYGSRLPFLL